MKDNQVLIEALEKIALAKYPIVYDRPIVWGDDIRTDLFLGKRLAFIEGYKANNSLDVLEKWAERELDSWIDRDASNKLTSDYNRAMIHSFTDLLKQIQSLKNK
jgi:hypothetical protein